MLQQSRNVKTNACLIQQKQNESESKSQQQDFCKAQENPCPPDQFRKKVGNGDELMSKSGNCGTEIGKNNKPMI